MTKSLHIVTGANGYLGREIVHSLLEEAKTTTTAGAADDENTTMIVCLVRPGRVESEECYWNKTMQDGVAVRVMPYDMLDKGITLEAALQTYDCENQIVYHVASVFGPTENPIETAKNNLRGTLSVVRTMAHFPKSALVLTSSMAAVRGTGQSPQNGKVYTHLDWNTRSQLLDKDNNWGCSYQWSKTQSEQQAQDLCKSLGVPMTSLCPSFIMGPTRPTMGSNSCSYSVKVVGKWIQGESPVQSRLCVDVRDVAKAHVVAGKKKFTCHRFLVSRDTRLAAQEMAQALRSHSATPEKITFDSTFCPAIPIGEQEVDAEHRLKEELGITLRPLQETIADMSFMLSSKIST